MDNRPTQKQSAKLPKRMRLSGPSRVDRLFAVKPVVSAYPFKIFCRHEPPACATPTPAFVIAIPKRQVRLATGRNRLRRQVRDVLRRQLSGLVNQAIHANSRDWHLAILWVGGKNVLPFAEIEAKLCKALARLAALPLSSLPGADAHTDSSVKT